MPHESVSVDLDAGTAVLQVGDLHMKDYFTLENAVLENGRRPRPATVSYVVRWTAKGVPSAFDNPDQHFRGTFRSASAQMEWTAQTPDYDFRSSPLATSTTDGAQLGHESNGSFY
ncbi:MAG: hypothetical protein QOC92_3052 [Acidimicrobiaceae bacterium]